jgi:aspartate carbamoyltransferase catalytic subunit
LLAAGKVKTRNKEQGTRNYELSDRGYGMRLKSKDLLGLRDITKEEIMLVLETAKSMKYLIDSPSKKAPHLQGKTVINLFFENSTRTRLSFELAAKYMSANSANISASSSSVKKGETLIDTGKTIDMMGTDIVIMRHPYSGSANLLARNIKASVINAGDGMNEHPTQALLDLFTIYEKFGKFKDLKIAIVGDICHSRVARSNIWGMSKMGMDISLAGPGTLIPPEIEKTGVKVYHTVQEAILDVDIIMGLRIQKERQKKALFPNTREYAKYFGLDIKRLKLAKDGVFIMHPGPVNRGVELSSLLIDHDNSLINEQVKNGVAIRMALLYLLTRSEKNENIN